MFLNVDLPSASCCGTWSCRRKQKPALFYSIVGRPSFQVLQESASVDPPCTMSTCRRSSKCHTPDISTAPHGCQPESPSAGLTTRILHLDKSTAEDDILSREATAGSPAPPTPQKDGPVEKVAPVHDTQLHKRVVHGSATKQVSCSRGSSNAKRTSLLSNAQTPPSTSKRNKGSRAGETFVRRIVTPPIVANAMKDTPTTPHQPDCVAKDKKSAQLEVTATLELATKDNDANSDGTKGRTIVQPGVFCRPSLEVGSSQSSPLRTGQQTAEENAGIFSWTDAQLAQRYVFDKEVGFGNWGSCWLASLRKANNSKIGTQPYAIKLVHRQGTPASNARVKALWNEFKVLRSCGKPIHDNLVKFKEFVITPSYALVVMDYYRQAMNVALPVSMYAGPDGYFHQLLSSINWLHERNVTHCDIKVANLLVDTSKDKLKGKPVLVDFGFATIHDAKSNFLSRQSWGTPEYLSPERNRGDLHDERLSDMWALGVTFFEIATGRTPFEHEDEQFLTKEQLDVYYRRTLDSEWVGVWSLPADLENMCHSMLAPDPKKRIYCNAALRHPFFRNQTGSNCAGDIDESLRQELDAVQVPSLDSGDAKSTNASEQAHGQSVGSATTVSPRSTLVTQINPACRATPQSSLPNAIALPVRTRRSHEVVEFGRGSAGTNEDLTAPGGRNEANYKGSLSKMNATISMLASPFRRNKKRAAACPPSSFTPVKLQRGSQSYVTHRRSSEGTLPQRLKSLGGAEFETKAAQKETNTAGTTPLVANISEGRSLAGRPNTHSLKKLGSHSGSAQVDSPLKPQNQSRRSELMLNTLMQAAQSTLRGTQGSQASLHASTCSVTGDVSKQEKEHSHSKPLPVKAAQDDDSGKQRRAKGSFRPSTPLKNAVLTTVSRGGKGHTYDRLEADLSASLLQEGTAEELSIRLAEMRVVTNHLARMVQESQNTLQKLQQRTFVLSASSPYSSRTMHDEEARITTSMPLLHTMQESFAEHYEEANRRTSEVLLQVNVPSPMPSSKRQSLEDSAQSIITENQGPQQVWERQVEKAHDHASYAMPGAVSTSGLTQTQGGCHSPIVTDIATSKAVAYAPHAETTAKQSPQHFFDDGSHEDLGISEHVSKTLSSPACSKVDAFSISPKTTAIPAASSPRSENVKESTWAKTKASEDPSPLAFLWPPSKAGHNTVIVHSPAPLATLSSRTFQNTTTTSNSESLPRLQREINKNERKFKLSKVKSLTLGRSNSVSLGTPHHANDRSSNTLGHTFTGSQKRNMVTDISWDGSFGRQSRFPVDKVVCPTKNASAAAAAAVFKQGRRRSNIGPEYCASNGAEPNGQGQQTPQWAGPQPGKSTHMSSAVSSQQGANEQKNVWAKNTAKHLGTSSASSSTAAKAGGGGAGVGIDRTAMSGLGSASASPSSGSTLWKLLASKVHPRR